NHQPKSTTATTKINTTTTTTTIMNHQKLPLPPPPHRVKIGSKGGYAENREERRSTSIQFIKHIITVKINSTNLTTTSPSSTVTTTINQINRINTNTTTTIICHRLQIKKKKKNLTDRVKRGRTTAEVEERAATTKIIVNEAQSRGNDGFHG
ncbi:Hypothetical predicted protein, partial [Olea europaea subsp. europaea]